MDKSAQLRAVAQRVADGLPAAVAEVVLTGSVSRGVADEFSDVEMLVVSDELPRFDASVGHAQRAGLERVDTWTPADATQRRLGGVFDDVPIELVWWSRAFAEERVAALAGAKIRDGRLTTADALAHGVPLRSMGLLDRWQEQLRRYPPELTVALVTEATWMWRGYQPDAVLTVVRPGERVPLVERLVADAQRVVRIVFALNATWEPTLKRLAARVEPLAVKPPRLAEWLEAALLEPDPHVALRSTYELVAETLALVPPEIDVARSRAWVAEVLELLA